jgi:hypothetical protein
MPSLMASVWKPDCSDEVFPVYLQEFVLSRNLRRRHLSVGQKAAIVLDWSEQIELSPAPEKNKERGRPKRTLSEAAKHIGINEQRVFEVRQIRYANPILYREVKDGRRSLNSALAEIGPPRETRFQKSDLENSESRSQEPDWAPRTSHHVARVALRGRLGENAIWFSLMLSFTSPSSRNKR